MKKVIASAVILSFLVNITLSDTAFAGLYGSSQSTGNPASAQLGQIAQASGAAKAFQPDLFTGRAQTGIPIFVPPGRKGIQPALGLSYSSSGGNGWLGVGWGLDMGSISRDLKKGAPRYDATDTYAASFQGVSSELVSVAANEYRAKDEAMFLKFVFDSNGNSWTVTDKSGTQYQFGANASSRIEIAGKGTFKWALCKVMDPSGNKMDITYTVDGGELYLDKIEYNANETQNFAHTHSVDFVLEDRTDKSFSYISGGRIELNKRLKEIQVKAKDAQGVYQLARKYALTYNTSPSSQRSRLYQVREYGTDGTITLPAVTFTYQDKALQFDAMVDFSGLKRAIESIDYDFGRAVTTSGDTLVDMADMNGDGRADRVQAAAGNAKWKCQLNNGTSFDALANAGTLEKPSSWSGYDCITKRTDAGEQATELLDINGDGLPDRIIAQDGNMAWKVQINNGSGFDAPTAQWSGIQRMESGNVRYDYIRYTPTGSNFSQTLVDFFDINGDGLPDRVQSREGNTHWKVQLNTGSGFSALQDFGPIENAVPSDTRRTVIRYTDDAGETVADMADINGDGLPDRVMSVDSNTHWKVQFNTGSRFTSMQNFGPITRLIQGVRNDHIRFTSSSGEAQVDLFDINGDGLPDRVQGTDSNTYWKVQYNTGTGFNSTLQDFGPIQYMTNSVRYSYPRWYDSSGQISLDVMDIDGDGLPDRCQAVASNGAWKVQTNKGPYPDLLQTVENGRGGKTTIKYAVSTEFDNREAAPGGEAVGGKDAGGVERLPFPVQVVSEVKQEDGMGHSVVTNYSYKGGMFDSANREFRGFREVTVTDSAGTKSIHTFGQTDHNKGRLLAKEVRDTAGNLFSKEETTWEDAHPWGESVDVHFVRAAQVDAYLYDGDATFKHTRQTFTYDAYGNLASTTEQGDVDVTGDERKTVNEYVYSTAAPGAGSGTYIVNALKKTTICAADFATKLSERYFYYDGASSIDTAPVKGLLTKEEEWLSGGVNPSTQMAYDGYGNIVTITDARGYQTTNEYESTYHLFLTKITNALGHTREFTYDPWIAQITSSKDQNGQVTTTQYDALGRVTKVISPLDSASEPTQEMSYDLSATPNKTTVKIKTSKPGEAYACMTIYSFTDGLGREIQKRSPAENANQQIVTGNVSFDNRGLVTEQWNPYFETASQTYVAPSASLPKAAFTYDAVGRRTRVDYPDATFSTVAFSDFVKTATDPRGKQARYTNDAYGRLIKVEEFSAGATYTTTYEYDTLNNLKKTTDHAGNQTTIQYDTLSRKTGMTDPDMGTWAYQYDANDNLIRQTDAKNQTITFTYDALNRVTVKDVPNGAADAAYTYDDPAIPYSKGRLTKVDDGSGKHEFKYDVLGRVTEDKKTVDNIPYTFTRTYDAMGRVRALTYPDTEVVTYAYNGFGDVETIQGVKNAVTTDYVKNLDYNAAGQITFIKYGNNVTSDYTYNPQTLRLDKIQTKKSDGVTKLQDLSYAFDAVGNVTHISDLVNAMSQDFTYDDLNRLIQAVGSAYGTQTFQYDAVGNMTRKAGLNMNYGEAAPAGGGQSGAKPHAVMSVTGASLPTYCQDNQGPCTFDYDANGNMTRRASDTLAYDSENRLKEVRAFEPAQETQSYTLHEGWNLISFTYLPDDKSITNVLSSLTFGADYDQISTGSPLPPGEGQGEGGQWKHFVNDPDFNDFTSFEYGKSYEIYVTKAGGVTFSVTGKSPAVDITTQIKTGENFIGPGVKEATAVSTVLAGLSFGADYSDIKRFNASTQSFELYSQGAFSTFEPGKGYVLVGLRDASFNYGETEKVTTFVYDSAGSRVKKVENNSTTVYLGKDFDVQSSLTPQGGAASLASKYIFLGSRRIATKDSGGILLFIHDDHISSSNVVTDSSGNQAALYEYDPYGATVTHTGTADLKHRYTGQEADDTTGLYYYNARYYDPQLGRFVSADPTVQHPTDPQDLNRYAYARNNPVMFNDPTGLGFFASFLGVAGAALGYAVAGPLGAIFGGAFYGALGGLADAAIAGQSLKQGALQGGINGAMIGVETAMAGNYATASGGGGGAASSPQTKILDARAIEGVRSIAPEAAQSIGETGTSSIGQTIISNIIGESLAYAAPPNEIHLEAYSRPAKFLGMRHLFLYDRTNNRIWEMVSSCTDGNRATCGLPGAPLGFIKTRMREGADLEEYLSKWSNEYRKEYTVSVQQDSFYKAIEMYEQRNKGLPYNPAWQNSNYAARHVVERSGGQGQSVSSAPKSAFDVHPALAGTR